VSHNNGTAAAAKIFVLCTPRSGSTLLRYILDAHSKICCPPELSLGPLAEQLYWAVFYSVAQAQTSMDDERHPIAIAEVRRVIDDLMCSYASLKQKEFWCEKTPKNLQHAQRLNEAFPDAAYICLYRNCLDMVYSSIEGSRYGKMDELWDYRQIYQAWIEQTGELLKFEREYPSRCFRIKYEALVLDPPGVLRKLFDFLGVEWEAQLIDQVFTAQHDIGRGDPKVNFSNRIYQNAIGKGSSIKRESVPPPLLEKINLLLQELDYPIVGPNWNHTRSPYLPTAISGDNSGQLAEVAEIFTAYIPRRLHQYEQTLSDLNGTLKIVVKGDDGGIWKVTLDEKPARVIDEDGSADCTITVVSGDLLKIANGELNAGECFLQARLRVAGDELLAYKLGHILFGA
jgi:protein-tyrosine sulfotransferase